MYKKITIYSLFVLWITTIGSIIFVSTIVGNNNSMYSFFLEKEDTSNYSFYNKKLLNRNEKVVFQKETELVEVKSQEAIKSTMLRQSVKLKTIEKTETIKPKLKEKIPLKKPISDGFEIKPLPRN